MPSSFLGGVAFWLCEVSTTSEISNATLPVKSFDKMQRCMETWVRRRKPSPIFVVAVVESHRAR